MVQNWYPASSLLDGSPGALASIDGDLLADGDRAIVISDSYVYFYLLDADSGLSMSSPSVISPTANAGAKRWILRHPYPQSM